MEDISRLNKSVFGNLNGFRPLQSEAVEAMVQGKDVFLAMPTGAGKSLCFQLPALIGSGVTIVICPLVSLILDQVMQLDLMGVRAAALGIESAKRDTLLSLVRPITTAFTGAVNGLPDL